MSPASQPDAAALEASSRRAARLLHGLQAPDGCWRGFTGASPQLESEWLLHALWRNAAGGAGGTAFDAGRAREVTRLVRRAAEDGGPAHPSTDILAYFVLKAAGESADAPFMALLRRRITQAGGLARANQHTRILLSLFGAIPRNATQAVPPELILVPGGFWRRIPGWLQSILAPLSILQALTADSPRPAPSGFALDELRRADRPLNRVNGFAGLWARLGPAAVRRRAVERMREWMLSWGAEVRIPEGSSPALQYALMAMDALQVAPHSAGRRRAEEAVAGLFAGHSASVSMQPGLTVVRDTALAAFVLGAASHGRLGVENAARWLNGHAAGAGAVQETGTEAAAMSLLALSVSGAREGAAPAVAALLESLEAAQSRNGGWALSGAAVDSSGWSRALFQEEGADLEIDCPALTGWVLNAFHAWRAGAASGVERRAVHFLRQVQEQDGSWASRFSGSYLQGACLALRGLRAAGFDDREAEVLRAGEWLRAVQNADGGWGERFDGQAGAGYAEAPSAPLPTAWAVLGLIAGGDCTSESVRRGVGYLLRMQEPEGGWTGSTPARILPPVSRVTHHIDALAFPLLAVSEYRRCKEGSL